MESPALPALTPLPRVVPPVPLPQGDGPARSARRRLEKGVPTPLDTPFQVVAYHLYETIALKSLKEEFGARVIGSSPHELQIRYSDTGYLFIYRFGCLVFANVPEEERKRELKRVRGLVGPGGRRPEIEAYEVHPNLPTQVEFETVRVQRCTLEILRIICHTVGQSAALDHFEGLTDGMLEDSGKYIRQLSRQGAAPLASRQLLKSIGSTAATRQHILSYLSVLDPPEETWDSSELESLYRALQENFDIQVRFRTLDRKLTLTQENLEILANLTSTKQGHLLEMLVVMLIVLEIVLAFVGHS